MAKQTDKDADLQIGGESDPVTLALLRIQEENAENMRRQLDIAERQLAFQQQTLDEDRRVRPRENVNHPGISAFSYPEGELKRPKPMLKRVTYWPQGVKLNEDLLTPEEIQAFNAIDHSCTARDGSWTATVTRNGTTEILEVIAPVKTPDDRMNLPNGLLLILRELREGPESVDVGSMAARIARLEAQLAASSAAS